MRSRIPREGVGFLHSVATGVDNACTSTRDSPGSSWGNLASSGDRGTGGVVPSNLHVPLPLRKNHLGFLILGYVCKESLRVPYGVSSRSLDPAWFLL